MTIKIDQLDDWLELVEGQIIDFPADRARKVSVFVNSPDKTHLVIVRDGKADFPVAVEGMDNVQFYTDGAYSLTVSAGYMYVYTADGTDTHSVVIAPEIFTRIVERKRRNPELERMQWAAEQNMERLFIQQANALEEMRKQYESAGTSPPVVVPPVSAPAPVAPPSTAPVEQVAS